MTSISLPIDILNTYISVPVYLGTPPQKVNLHPDLGSDSVWALTPSCDRFCLTSYKNTSRLSYNSTASSTAQLTPELYDSITYLGGYVSGRIARDVLSLGDIPSPSPNLTIAFIQASYSTWSALRTTGFMGLSFPALSHYGNNIYLSLYKESVGLKSPTALLFLGSATSFDANPSPPNNGVLQFGATEQDTRPYTDCTVSWFDVLFDNNYNAYTLWMTTLDAVYFEFDGAPVDRVTDPTSGIIVPNVTAGPLPGATTNGTARRAILDSGAGLMSVPDALAESLYAAIGVNYTFISHGGRPLCSDIAAIESTVTFVLGGRNVTVSARDLARPGYTEDKYCWPVFTPWDSPDFILGSVFLQSFVWLFDMGTWVGDGVLPAGPKIGVAPLKEGLKRPIFPSP